MSGGFAERAGGGGRVCLVSSLLEGIGVPHGFTTAAGGLNVRTADDFSPVLADAGLAGRAVHLSRQPHGARVSRPGDREAPADAHLGAAGGDAVAVRTADCLAVLLAGPGGVVAAHAGWRGLLAGVLENAVAALGGGLAVEAAAIGPAISWDRFEIGPEVAAAFRRAGHGASLRPGRGDRSHADLLHAARTALGRTGVEGDRIDAAGRCTHGEPASFHSHRREGPGHGHQAGWIAAV